MTSRAISIFLVLTVTLGSTLVLGIPVVHATSGSSEDPKPVDSCFSDGVDPSESGIYVLTRDINATDLHNNACFDIENGAVIEGNGHTIQGNGIGVGIEGDSDRIIIRNTTITGFETGIAMVNGEVKIFDSTISNNSEYGFNGLRIFPPEEGLATVWRSTITGNGVGIAGSFNIHESRIVDNLRHGLSAPDAGGSVTRSIIAGNGEPAVVSTMPNPFFGDPGVDARFNYWGTPDGPGSGGPAAPVADPVTGALANGSGDHVGHTEDVPNTSNVQFDPYLTTPPGESAYDGHYQVDLVVGDPIPQLSAERLYTDERRLVGFLHGQGDEVERTGTAPTLVPEAADCVDIQSWTVENGTATVAFTVAEGCSSDLTLVSYEKPGSGFSRETADQQRLYDFEQRRARVADQTYTLQVDLPETTTNDDESAALAAPSAVTWHSIGGVR